MIACYYVIMWGEGEGRDAEYFSVSSRCGVSTGLREDLKKSNGMEEHDQSMLKIRWVCEKTTHQQYRRWRGWR